MWAPQRLVGCLFIIIFPALDSGTALKELDLGWKDQEQYQFQYKEIFDKGNKPYRSSVELEILLGMSDWEVLMETAFDQ